MNTAKGTRLVSDFVRTLNEQTGVTVNRTAISRNIFEFNGKKNCLLYVKGRAEKP